MSRRSASYPSWLPTRPPSPAPPSTINSPSIIPAHDNFHASLVSRTDIHDEAQAGPSQISPPPPSSPPVGGRKPKTRSVRIIKTEFASEDHRTLSGHAETSDSLPHHREPTDRTRISYATPVGPNADHARGWSRATAPTLLASSHARASTFGSIRNNIGGRTSARPRFRAKGLQLDLLADPTVKARLHFYAFRLGVFLHIPVQTFLDFNVAFMLLQ